MGIPQQHKGLHRKRIRTATMEKSRLYTCFYLLFGIVLASVLGNPTRPQQQGIISSSSNPSNSLLMPIKKDVFMSRGWGASGMPFTMIYLNHYTKAQKAYALNQQQQLQKIREQEAEENKLRSEGDELRLEQPRSLPSRQVEMFSNTEQNETNRTGYKEDEYIDSGVYLQAKPSTPRRQYNIPQLFVSYGWGPMG